jgi:hypothetical protein
MISSPPHPAKFSQPILDAIEEAFEDYGCPSRVLDPFAGTGGVHKLGGLNAIGVEIEPEWARAHPNNIVGNALHLPFRANCFDGMITSPCYGNRLADNFNARDSSKRHSYMFDLGRRPHRESSGTLHWGRRYQGFHDAAWTECSRVLKPKALVMLNVSNHIRNKKEQPVAQWHFKWFMDHGCELETICSVSTSRMRYGQNHEARSSCEYIFIFRCGDKKLKLGE